MTKVNAAAIPRCALEDHGKTHPQHHRCVRLDHGGERGVTRGTPMAHKQVLFRSAAREKVLHGATQLADAISVTLGPRSKSVLIS